MAQKQSRSSRGDGVTTKTPFDTSFDLPVLNPIPACWIELGPKPFFGLNPIPGLPPEPMSGQISAIVVDGNLVYIGSSSGGLWKYDPNATPEIQLVSDQTRSLSVGSIAIRGTEPRTIYVGTGAPDNSSNISSYTGVGILISQDNGRTWKRVENADNGLHTFVGQGFSTILVDPVEPNVLLASTGFGTDPNHPHSSIPQGNPAFNDLGIYRSQDSGDTWTQVMSADYREPEYNADLLSPGGFFHIDLLYAPFFNLYFAGVSKQRLAGVSKQGLFVSRDHGSSWLNLQTQLGWGLGLPDPNQMLRISLATRDRFLWVLILMPPADPCDPNSPFRFQLFQSDDGGLSWTTIQPLPSRLLPKGGLMYVAAPPNSSALLVAAEHLHWRADFQDPASQWEEIEGLHGDQHAIAFASADTWYIGDDGGLWASISPDHKGLGNLNLPLPTLEFYSAAADSADKGSYAGGLQDNGPATTSDGPPVWSQLEGGGDGGYVLADPQDSGAFFMSAASGDSFSRGGIFHVRLSTPGDRKSVILWFANIQFAD
jgi:hypothetical protein